MAWNWQLSDWPEFTWDKARLALAEQQFLVGGGVLLGTIKHLGEDDRSQLTVEAMSTEAVTTSEIEGEILDRASVQSSIQRLLGLGADNRRGAPREQGDCRNDGRSLPRLLRSTFRGNDIRVASNVDDRQAGH
jgi:Fic family protein